MRTHPALPRGHRRRRPQAVSLIECLVYIGALSVIFVAAVSVFTQVLDFSCRLRQNADDIVRVLKAGERWRADVRSAVAPIAVEQDGDTAALSIPGPEGPVTYLFLTNAVLRRQAGDPVRQEMLLTRVKQCQFEQDDRHSVRSWRWELELASTLKAVRVRPQFAFTAVPQSGQEKPR